MRDYGPGFSQKALFHGKEAFFSGDESRHDRTHQGLGLSIAADFMKRQGGFVEYQNVDKSQGAEVDLYEEIIGFPESVLLHGRYHDILKNKVILSGSKMLF